MLAQLKTVVLIKEAIKLAFFRLVEYLAASAFVGSITGSKRPETKNVLLKLVSLVRICIIMLIIFPRGADIESSLKGMDQYQFSATERTESIWNILICYGTALPI